MRPSGRRDDGVDERQQEALATEIELTALAQTPGRRAVRGALRFGPAALVLAVLAVVARSGLLGQLSLESLRADRLVLVGAVQAHPVLCVLAYVAAYTVSVGLSLPVALLLTLTGGFLFGPWVGGLAAAFSCSAGAAAVFLISRLTVGDAVSRRTGPRVQALAEEIRKDAFFYLLTLRLIPVAPFWLANVAAGLIAIPVPTFVAATFIGILPPSIIYAGVGSGLEGLFAAGGTPALHDLVTPGMVLPLVGLAVLSVLPILYQRRRNRQGRAA